MTVAIAARRTCPVVATRASSDTTHMSFCSSPWVLLPPHVLLFNHLYATSDRRQLDRLRMLVKTGTTLHLSVLTVTRTDARVDYAPSSEKFHVSLAQRLAVTDSAARNHVRLDVRAILGLKQPPEVLQLQSRRDARAPALHADPAEDARSWVPSPTLHVHFVVARPAYVKRTRQRPRFVIGSGFHSVALDTKEAPFVRGHLCFR